MAIAEDVTRTGPHICSVMRITSLTRGSRLEGHLQECFGRKVVEVSPKKMKVEFVTYFLTLHVRTQVHLAHVLFFVELSLLSMCAHI